MTKYWREFTKDFLKDIKKIKSHYEIQKRLKDKIEEIIENPSHYKPLRNILKKPQTCSYRQLCFDFRD